METKITVGSVEECVHQAPTVPRATAYVQLLVTEAVAVLAKAAVTGPALI